MDNIIPFPQADDFDKIIQIINFPNDEDLNNITMISSRLGDISGRQVSYYISATMFLGFIESKNEKKVFTQQALRIRSLNSYMQIAEIISVMLLNPVFNKVFVNTILFGKQEIDDISIIIKQYYPNYSDTIYKRRSQTVISWVDWIIKHTNYCLH